LAILGSGGGGFAAAIAARRRNLRAIMVERSVVGGTCVNIGCIPSKALLAAAEARYRAAGSHFAGISTTAGDVDMARLVDGKNELVGDLRQSKYIELADEYGFELIEGNARFVEGPALDVDGRRMEAAQYLVATGAEEAIPAISGLTDSGYLTSTTAMELRELPESLIVIGGGYVAMEQAQLFAHLGTRVTMLVRSVLARREEPEVSERIRAAFEAQGIDVFERLVPDAVRHDGAEVLVSAGDREFGAERVLVKHEQPARVGGRGRHGTPAIRLRRREARRSGDRERLRGRRTAVGLQRAAANHFHEPDDRFRRNDRSPGP
jgi:mercuric reductase